MMYAIWDGGEYVLYIDAETRGKARAEAACELGLDFTAKMSICKAIRCDCGKWSTNGQCWDCYEAEQAQYEAVSRDAS